jgi:hypothetical protein
VIGEAEHRAIAQRRLPAGAHRRDFLLQMCAQRAADGFHY